jgi:DNA adenine methylase
VTPRKLFRWPGSKDHLAARVAPLVRAHLDKTGGRIVSPFFGGGAIELAIGLPCARIVAADACPELRALYRALNWPGGHDDLYRRVHELDALAGRSPAGYARVRALRPLDDETAAARFLYLQSLAFNGLWRVNAQGDHNVPCDPGRLAKRDPFPGLEAFTETRRLTRGLDLLRDWWAATDEAQPGDCLVVDPPYGAFDGFTAGGFSAKDHRLLARRLLELHQGGCAVVAFNAPGAEPLYHRWASIERLQRSGRMSSKGDGRQAVAELLITAGLQAAQVAA